MPYSNEDAMQVFLENSETDEELQGCSVSWGIPGCTRGDSLWKKLCTLRDPWMRWAPV